ncbi:MAG: DUF3795 domain-containing protein [Anaerolineales bacterium]
METIHLAYCGLNCAECPVFIATITNDTELKQRTADEWGKNYSEYIGKKELTVEDMNCHGCQSVDGIRFVGCENCPIRKCSSGKNLTTCADCTEYTICAMLNGFFTTASQAKENLERIRAQKRR